MNDLALIQTFVQGFVRGEAILLSNPNLKIEPTFGTIQLLARKEGLMATATLTDKPRSVLVKQKSSYWELIHQSMLGESCFPIRLKDSFYTYQHRTIPKGYQMHCTNATELLQRTWWRSRSHNRRLGISMDLLVLTRGTWYPIRDLDLSPRNETVFIKTLGGELTLHRSDIVVWLKRVNEHSSNATTAPTSDRGLGSGYLRPKA